MAHCVCSMEKKWDRAKGPISTPFDRTGYQSSSLRRSVRPYMYVVAYTVWHGSSSSRVGCLCVFSKPFLLFSIVVGLSDKRRSKQASATSSISIEKYSRLEQQWEKSLTKIHLERGVSEWVSSRAWNISLRDCEKRLTAAEEKKKKIYFPCSVIATFLALALEQQPNLLPASPRLAPNCRRRASQLQHHQLALLLLIVFLLKKAPIY